LEFIVNRKAFEALPSDIKVILKAATLDLSSQIFTEYEFFNTEAMLKIAKERNVQLRLFPQAVLKELEMISSKVLEEEASRDAMSRRVHDAYVSFKKDIRKFSLLKGAKMRI
jgi:TRAP-type mannitol/chloroaromatic compound transport system substrate-binding protein